MTPRLRLAACLRAALLFAVVAAIGCSDSTAPTTGTGGNGPPRSNDSLNTLRPAPGAPAIANPVVAFYAKKGEDREAFMYYRPDSSSGRDSAVFLRLRVRQRSLDQRPDGSPIAEGDSVLITITLVDAARLIVDCQPAGLRFSASDPADLKMSYLEADQDLNDDGSVNSSDQQLLGQLQIWRRETPDARWEPLQTEQSTETHEVESQISGFTSYAIAY